MSEVRGYPFGTKAEFLGKSKIERGLSQFRIYRVASNRRLLLPDSNSNYSTPDVIKDWLGKSLHFSTQKNMVQEYATDKKPVIFEQRGVDFLEDLQKLDDQGVRIMLLSHIDLIQMGKIKVGEVKGEEARNFLESRTHRPSKVTIRNLRSAAEIAVLMPEDMPTLPLRQKTIKKHPIQCIYKRKREGYMPGQFHEKVAVVRKQKDRVRARLKREQKRLEKERADLIVEEEQSWRRVHVSKAREIKRIDRALAEIRRKMRSKE
jgi:hypothetical protein